MQLWKRQERMAELSTLSDTSVAAVVWRRCQGPELW